MPRNPFEEGILKDLKALGRKLKFTVDYESEVLSYTIPTKPRRYTPDFVIHASSGKTIYIETKGYLRAADRVKLLAVRASNPSIDLRIIFQKDQPITKRSKTMYSDWANKHGIPYAIRTIPIDWFRPSSTAI